MTFFYDINKKLQQVLDTPKSEHMQLNERDEGKPGKNFAKIAKDAGERYGSKAAGERVAGAVRNKLKAQGKLEEEGFPRIQAAIQKYTQTGVNKLAKLGREGASKAKMAATRKEFNQYDNKEVDEGVMDTVKKVGKKVASGVNKLVGHGSDEDMRKDLQRKVGVPPTGKKPEQQVKEKLSPAKQKSFAALAPPRDKITFADKIAGAKKEVDEMLGDVAAEAMRKAVGGGRSRNAEMDEGAAIDTTGYSPEMQERIKNSTPQELSQMAHELAGDPSRYSYEYKKLEAVRSLLRGTTKHESKGRNPKSEMDEERSKGTAFDMSTPREVKPKVGSVERGHKHDIKHTATGRVVTRRTDDQGHSVGADDESDADGAPRGRGRPKGTKNVSSRAKVFQRKSKLMTKEGHMDPADQGEYDQEGDMAKDDIQTIVRHAKALHKILGDNDNLPEWVQSKLAKIEGMMISIDEYMQNEKSNDGEEQELDEKAVSKQQQKFMGMAHAMQKGEKIKGASKELKKVAKTMKPKDVEDFAATKHKGLPDKVKPKKKKEEEVEESSTTAGSVAPSTATTGGKGGVFGKGIYDSMNRELEKMIAESMSVNMSDSTEGGKSLTITATDEDALKLGMLLKNAGLGGGGDMHDHGAEPCETCGSMDCGCGDVHQEVDENAPDWPTNTETNDDALQYAGGLNKPKTDVAGDGQTTIPNTAVHTQDEDVLRRMMEMAGIKQSDLEPWKETMKEQAVEEAAKPDFLDLDKDGDKEESMKDAAKDKEEDIEESIQRMREMAGIKEAKKPDYLDFDKDGDKKEPMTKALKDKEKKVEESIFTLTNQWKAYRG